MPRQKDPNSVASWVEKFKEGSPDASYEDAVAAFSKSTKHKGKTLSKAQFSKGSGSSAPRKARAAKPDGSNGIGTLAIQVLRMGGVEKAKAAIAKVKADKALELVANAGGVEAAEKLIAALERELASE